LPVVIEQDTVGRALQIVELPGSDGPQKCRHDYDHQYHRHRNQDIENIHRCGSYSISSRVRPRRRLLATTRRELADIPIAAIQGATKPAAAVGMARRL